MLLPDFLIIGAMKCGTSTLQVQLAAQEGVFMTTPKEPNFFSDDAVWARGRNWYEGLFATAAAGQLKGEASTHYTKLPTHPRTLERMQQVLPSAPRLVYMIRNPLDRAVSHLVHEWTEARMPADPERAFADHPELVDYGRYGMQAAPFVAAYGADRIQLTSLERLTAEPEAEFARICDFLGIEGAAWRADIAPQNVSAERVRKLPLHGLLVANPVATALRRALVPKALRDRIRRGRRMSVRPHLTDALRARLTATFLDDRTRLAALFPGHPALVDCYPFAT